MIGEMKKTEPTYTATEIKAMCSKMDMDHDSFKVLAELIDEEIDLYEPEDIPVLMMASMIIFTRSLMKISLKNIR
jgi:hypothetical protein